MKRTFLIFAIFLVIHTVYADITVVEPEKVRNHSFAIVIDEKSYNEAESAVMAYRDAVENDGLGCYILTIENATPDEIKTEIIKIYNDEKHFEGIVLIGDVPVPMIRDAHHLSSAFKMDPERFALNRSSIASDRFYDDFDLKFEFLQQDTSDATLFYYSLSAESVQKIDKEIYSARIKAPVSGNEKYELLRNYLQRIARQKAGRNEIRHMLTFTGHGYHSESLASWEWDLLSLREQFPQLYKPGYSIKNLNHASSPHMKKIILTELQNPDLDMVIFHAHGSDDTQYLNGFPPARNTAENIRDVKLYLRSKLRQAKRWKRDPEEYKTHFIEKLGVPEDWFDGAFVDSVMTADSIYSADLDIYASDLKGIQTQPKFVMFDECYNGQFTKNPYIAGKYIFSGGNTIVTVANTVNVKQDIWANEFLGMLNLGLRAGEWHKTREFLESHLIGDPTFHFDAAVPEKLVDNLYKDRSEKFWLEQLQHEAPVRRSIAVAELFRLQKYQFIDDLVDIYRHDPAFIVRLQALRCLSETRAKAFEDILLLTAKDPAEMIRRITTIWMGRIGREDYLPVLAELMLHDHSDRVSRQAEESMEFIDPDKALQTAGKMIEKLPEIADREMLRESVLKGFERSHDWLYNDLLGTLHSDTMSVKEKKGAVRTFRNYTFHHAVDELCELALNENTDISLRVNVVETLGWFTFSKRGDEIIKTCDLLLATTPLDDKLRAETIKTKKRIIVGSNDPLVP